MIVLSEATALFNKTLSLLNLEITLKALMTLRNCVFEESHHQNRLISENNRLNLVKMQPHGQFSWDQDKVRRW